MSTSAQLAGNHAGLLSGEERTQLESLRNCSTFSSSPPGRSNAPTASKPQLTHSKSKIQRNEPKFVTHSSQTYATPPSKPVEMNLVRANQAENTMFAFCGTKPIQPLGLLPPPLGKPVYKDDSETIEHIEHIRLIPTLTPNLLYWIFRRSLSRAKESHCRSLPLARAVRI